MVVATAAAAAAACLIAVGGGAQSLLNLCLESLVHKPSCSSSSPSYSPAFIIRSGFNLHHLRNVCIYTYSKIHTYIHSYTRNLIHKAQAIYRLYYLLSWKTMTCTIVVDIVAVVVVVVVFVVLLFLLWTRNDNNLCLPVRPSIAECSLVTVGRLVILASLLSLTSHTELHSLSWHTSVQCSAVQRSVV
jgi:hypothetical protein